MEGGSLTIISDKQYCWGVDCRNAAFTGGTTTIRLNSRAVYAVETIQISGNDTVMDIGALDTASSGGLGYGGQLTIFGDEYNAGGWNVEAWRYLRVENGQYELLNHRHVWAEEWTQDENAHWHACVSEDIEACSITEPAEMYGYGLHTYNDDHVCTVCGQKDEGAAHVWNIEAATVDSDKHCTVCGYVAEEALYAQIVRVDGRDVYLALNNKEDCLCVAAFYDSRGMLLAAGSLEVSADAGAVTITLPDWEGQPAAVKVFFLNGNWAPLYERVEAEY